MKSKLWNGGFLRTVLQGLAVTCAALLALYLRPVHAPFR